MTELDWLMRSLSSITRLRILVLILHGKPGARGLRPAEIARLLHIPQPLVSFHLKSLLRARLVRYWKKSFFKFYRPPHARPGALRDRIALLLKSRLSREDALAPASTQRPGKDSEEQALRTHEHTVLPRTPFEPVWKALTCFSHFRRHLMIRHLLGSRTATLGTLTTVMDIHPLTVEYHAAKLIRRGTLRRTEEGYGLVGEVKCAVTREVWRVFCPVLRRTPHPVDDA